MEENGLTPEELKKFIESKGYDHVKVTVFAKSFKVSYWEPNYKNCRTCHFPISNLPSKFDGSRMALWLEQSFPSLYSEPQSAQNSSYENQLTNNRKETVKQNESKP